MYFHYSICIIFTICYPIPWLMHLCALINAKLKLNKSTSSSNPSHSDLYINKEGNYEDSIFRLWTRKFLSCFRTDDIQKSKLQSPPSTVSPSPILPQKILPYPSDKMDYSQMYRSSQNGFAPDYVTCDLRIAKSESPHLIDQDHSVIASAQCGVSIIKPLVGVDTNLEKNLETFFHMSYPKYELLFCVQDPEDAAIEIVRKLITKYVDIDARLFTGGADVGVNPKINNMQPAYEAAKYNLILISDSGIFMKRDTLYEMVQGMRDNIALIHQMPFVLECRGGLHSSIEKVFFGTAHARAYLTADLIGVNCPTGMSALMRKDLLDEVGGIKAFSQYLAEDFFFAKSFTDRGWDITIANQPAWQNSSGASDTFRTFTSRIERWIKLRFAMVPHWTLLEPLSECILLGILESLAYNYIWAVNPYSFFAVHVLIWYLLDYQLLRTIQGGPLDMSIFVFTCAWLVREFTALFVFLKALSNPLVVWRSRVFKLRWGGYAEELNSREQIKLKLLIY